MKRLSTLLSILLLFALTATSWARWDAPPRGKTSPRWSVPPETVGAPPPRPWSTLVSNDFEAGTGLWGEDANNDSHPSVSTGWAATGTKSIKCDKAAGATRAEISLIDANKPIQRGKDFIVTASYYLLSWTTDTEAVLIMQIHDGPPWRNPPISLRVQNGQWSVRICGDSVYTPSTAVPPWVYSNEVLYPNLGAVALSTKYDVRLEGRFSYGQDGYLKVSVNGSQILSHTGPTAQNVFSDVAFLKVGVYDVTTPKNRHALYVDNVELQVR